MGPLGFLPPRMSRNVYVSLEKELRVTSCGEKGILVCGDGTSKAHLAFTASLQQVYHSLAAPLQAEGNELQDTLRVFVLSCRMVVGLLLSMISLKLSAF